MRYKKEEWGGHKYIRVSKKRFENFIRYFKDKIEGNFFMGWVDYYDWSLNPGFDSIKADDNAFWDNIDKCMVARNYCEYCDEYYIREDYIKDKNYDLNTVVSKTKKHK